jgi:putative serine protease PepD
MSALRRAVIVVLVFLAGAFAGVGIFAKVSPPSLGLSAPALSAPAASAASVGAGGDFVTRVYNSASTCVVNITTTQTRLDFFFNPIPMKGVGSGVVIDKRGYILTNNHVIAGAETIQVTLADGKKETGKVIGADPGTDIALVKIDPTGVDLHVATLGDSSKTVVGEWVVAIGNPFGLDRTVTVGVIGALGRSIRSEAGQTINGLMQTDASINPGNSGGPLLNARGEVIGINTAILSKSGGSEGVGLAIPIDAAMKVVDELLKYGRVIRPWIGIEVREISQQMAQAYGLPVNHGLLVTAVYEASPAAKAGFIPPTPDDSGNVVYYIVTAVDGRGFDDSTALVDYIRAKKPGDKITVDYYRVNQKGNTSVTLEAIPTAAGARADILSQAI